MNPQDSSLVSRLCEPAGADAASLKRPTSALRVLFVSNLFPNAAEPTRGIFNAQQVAALAKCCHVEVIAPTASFFPDETRGDVRVFHPAFFHVPVLSRPLNGWLFARAIEPVVRRENFDVALVSWAYPDAYGVMLVAKRLRFPFATAVLGSDVNVLFQNPTRKRQILRALHASRVVFAKSKALQSRLADDGIASSVEYNGVDRQKFHPLDRSECCRKLGLDPNRKRVLFVGNLLPVKGPTILAEAFHHICRSDFQSRPSQPGDPKVANTIRSYTDIDLIFVGAGTERITAGRCVGARPHEEIPVWMNASDVLCLPSLNEGLPNVALEAMACGVPVVASNVGGVPEVVHDGVNGLLVPPSDAGALTEALRRAVAAKWERDAIVRSVAKFDWDVNARRVFGVLEKIVCN